MTLQPSFAFKTVVSTGVMEDVANHPCIAHDYEKKRVFEVLLEACTSNTSGYEQTYRTKIQGRFASRKLFVPSFSCAISYAELARFAGLAHFATKGKGKVRYLISKLVGEGIFLQSELKRGSKRILTLAKTPRELAKCGNGVNHGEYIRNVNKFRGAKCASSGSVDGLSCGENQGSFGKHAKAKCVKTPLKTSLQTPLKNSALEESPSVSLLLAEIAHLKAEIAALKGLVQPANRVKSELSNAQFSHTKHTPFTHLSHANINIIEYKEKESKKESAPTHFAKSKIETPAPSELVERLTKAYLKAVGGKEGGTTAVRPSMKLELEAFFGERTLTDDELQRLFALALQEVRRRQTPERRLETPELGYLFRKIQDNFDAFMANIQVESVVKKAALPRVSRVLEVSSKIEAYDLDLHERLKLFFGGTIYLTWFKGLKLGAYDEVRKIVTLHFEGVGAARHIGLHYSEKLKKILAKVFGLASAEALGLHVEAIYNPEQLTEWRYLVQPDLFEEKATVQRKALYEARFVFVRFGSSRVI